MQPIAVQASLTGEYVESHSSRMHGTAQPQGRKLIHAFIQEMTTWIVHSTKPASRAVGKCFLDPDTLSPRVGE